ncbi:MAG: MBL fold metallo-hydrolase [Anaerotardibacter sp.]
MEIIWYGTASVSLKSEKDSILFDPFVPVEKSPVHTNIQTYYPFKTIIVTHGHMDHISSIPEIWRVSSPHIYCTKTPYQSLQKFGVNEKSLYCIGPGQTFQIGPFSVTTYHVHHIVFDRELIESTLFNPRTIALRKDLLKEGIAHLHCPENHEILAYLVEAEGLSVFVMGSLGLLDEVEYPTGMDLLVLPYQGQTHLELPALEVIERLCPKTILLDHFDDTFPPLSKTVDTHGIQDALDGLIPVIKPHHQKPMILSERGLFPAE